MSDIKRCVSLYSYQDEFYLGKLDLEGCLRETAATGATGVELLAEQMIRKFPLPIETKDFRDQWFEWMKKYNLTPACYDAFLENHIYDNRTLTLKEQVNMMNRDIRLASLLGFPVLRTLVSTPMDVIEGSLPYAEEMGVKIGLEVHAPFSLNSGWADGYMEMIKRTGTRFFGFVPDMGIFCKNIPDVVRDKARRHGAKEECIKIVDDAYAKRVANGFTKIKYDLNLGKANMEYRMANGMAEMMDAVKAGGDRQELHERIRELSMEAGKTVKVEGKDNNLLELIAADPAFHLSLEELQASMDPKKYVGCSAHQVEKFLKEVVTPILDANKDDLGVKAEINV